MQLRDKDPSVSAVAGERETDLTGLVPSIYAIAAFTVLGAILIIALAPRIDTDFWWHLKVGQYIGAHHVVPSRDFMSFTFNGHPWTDHEWLAELLMYGLYSLAGLWGPITFFALVITGAFALVYATMIQRGVYPLLAVFVLVAAFVASVGSWGPRIQMVSLLFLAAYMLLLQNFQQTRNRRILALFPVLMLIWTNLHGGFVLGLVVIAITLAGETLNRRTGHEEALSPNDLRALLVTLVVTFAVTIVNPNTYHQLLYPLTFVLPNTFTNLIQESASPNFHYANLMVFEAMVLLLLVAALVVRPRLNWTHLLLILAFTHLAFSQVRNVPLWAIVISPILALYLQNLSWMPRRLEGPDVGRRSPALNLAMLTVVLVLFVATATRFITPVALAAARAGTTPQGGVSYLRHHSLPSRVFISYVWGGYLLWELFPRYRDFMDSRADTLYNPRILHAYLDAYAAAPDWRSVLKQYDVQTVLVERFAPLAQVLAEDIGWQLRYRDAQSVLYVRK